MISQKKHDIVADNNNIIIHRMDHPKCVSHFIFLLKKGIQAGYKDFTVIWAGTDHDAIYPNACVPVCGIIDYYTKFSNISFNLNISIDSYLKKCFFDNPIDKSANPKELEYQPFDKIYKYNEYNQVATITQSYINYLSKQDECHVGVIDGLIWCINEVMDNVLVHSNTNQGYVMAQYHSTTKHIAICVYDYGIGIYNSLSKSPHSPHSPIDAISLAIQEGVGDGQGQGNGLYGLSKIVQENNGSLNITSGSASLMLLSNKNIRKFDRIPYLSNTNNGTTVDFQLNISKSIDIQKAFDTIGGFDGFDIRIDDMLQDDDKLLYNVYNNCAGTATRQAGKELRNDVCNLLQRSNTSIILDFSQIETVSSSFIDEFISKLILQFGMINFNRFFLIRNMNDTIRFLCDRSTYMRIYEDWKTLLESKK